MEHDTEVFFWYAEQINLNVPNSWHKYLIIPDVTCPGCAAATVKHLFNESDSNTLIVTLNIFEKYIKEDIKGDIVIDSASTVNNLNWDLGNVIELHTENGEVIFAKSYSSEELICPPVKM